MTRTFTFNYLMLQNNLFKNKPNVVFVTWRETRNEKQFLNILYNFLILLEFLKEF